jgi:hypothetical protein
LELAARQFGYQGVVGTREDGGFGITVSYCGSLEAHRGLEKPGRDHPAALWLGRERWYQAFRLRIAPVERAAAWQKLASSKT